MTRRIEMQESGDILTVQWSRMGRLIAAIHRVIKLFPFVMGGFAIFFMPDYVCRFAEEEPVTGLFWGSIAALSLLICFLAGTLRYLRRDRWIFDGSDRILIAEVQTLWGEPATGEADLRNLEALMLHTRRYPWRSALHLRLESGEEEVLIEGHGMGEELDQTTQKIMDFLRDQRYHVDLERLDDREKEV